MSSLGCEQRPEGPELPNPWVLMEESLQMPLLGGGWHGCQESFGGESEKCKLRNQEVLAQFGGMNTLRKREKMIFKNLCEL